MFTVTELKKVHRNRLHTQLDKIFKILRRSDPTPVSTNNLGKLERIATEFDVCHRLANAPSRFRAAFPHMNWVFNRCVCIYLVKIRHKTVLHTVNRDTKFSAVRFLSNESTTAIWDLFSTTLAKDHVGCPDNLAFDQSQQFTSIECESLLSKCNIVPMRSRVESHNVQGFRVSVRERSLVSEACIRKICLDSPHINPELVLFIVTKVCNKTAKVKKACNLKRITTSNT